MTATWSPLYPSPHLGSLSSVQASTEAAPAAATDGLSLERAHRFNLFLYANAGTFTGVGVIRGWFYDSQAGLWLRAPGSDIGVPDEASGLARFAILGFDVSSQRGRWAPICDGVGVTAGDITLKVEATRLDGGLL